MSDRESGAGNAMPGPICQIQGSISGNWLETSLATPEPPPPLYRRGVGGLPDPEKKIRNKSEKKLSDFFVLSLCFFTPALPGVAEHALTH